MPRHKNNLHSSLNVPPLLLLLLLLLLFLPLAFPIVMLDFPPSGEKSMYVYVLGPNLYEGCGQCVFFLCMTHL